MIHHLDLNVSDLARSASFYAAWMPRLGYALGESGDGWLSWRSGTFYLCLVRTEERFRGRGFHRKGVGVNHLAFHAPSREAVDDLHRRLAAAGVPVLYGGPLEMGTAAEPNYAVFFEDPDRMKLEFVFRPGAPRAGEAR